MGRDDFKKKYLNDVWILFPLHGKKEKEYLKYLSKQIESREAEYAEEDYSSLSEEFGSPQEIVSSFYEEVEFDYIIKKMKIRSLIKKALISILIMLIVYVIWLLSLVYMNYLDAKQDIIKYEEEIIVED